MIKKVSAILLALIFLASCGKSISPDIGVYICEQITKDGERLSVSEFFRQPPMLTLAENNKAVLEINGELCSGTWENNEGELTLITGDMHSFGAVKDGKCTLDLFGQGIIYCFYSDSFSPQDSEEESEKNKNNRWSGDWYGYWGVQNASGSWESLDGQFFDCFAVIDMRMDNSGEITLWDEKSSLSKPMSVVQLKLAPASSLYGTAKSESGFFFSDDIEKGEWEIAPDKEQLENVLSFSAHYAGYDGEFDYICVLRPWGYVWDDAADQESIRLPYFYDQWYLPMLTGKSSMPASFEP